MSASLTEQLLASCWVSDFKNDDWLELALAALDQAGLSIRVQKAVLTVVEVELGLTWEEKLAADAAAKGKR